MFGHLLHLIIGKQKATKQSFSIVHDHSIDLTDF